MVRAVAWLLVVVFATGCSATGGAASPIPTLAHSGWAAGSPDTPPASTFSRPAASPSPIPMPTFTQLSAPSGAILWALVGGQRLFLSVDRGERWSEQAMPSVGPNVSISFVDEREGWALGGFPPATQCQAQAISLAHTNDGARSWQIFTGT